MAGQCKKGGDIESAYLNLKKYTILITERLAQHPSINDATFRDEYYFNKQKVHNMQTELDNLKRTIINRGDTSQSTERRNLPPPPVLSSTSKQQGSLPPPPPKSTSSSSSWSFSSIFGKKEQPKPLPPVPPEQKRLPPTPPQKRTSHQLATTSEHTLANNQQDLSDLTRDERLAYKAMGTLAYNDRVQTEVGNTVARIALNDQVQGKVADGVRNMALNEEYQQGLGNAIAQNTDNRFLKSVASNKNVQKAVGVSLAKTVGNKEMQKKAGMAVAKAATNKQVQQAAAKGFMGALKVGIKGAKLSGKGALTAGKMYVEHKRNSANYQSNGDDV